MEALWKIEDKLHLSTKKSIAIFACASFLLLSISIIIIYQRRKSRQKGIVHQEPSTGETLTQQPVFTRWKSVKKVLVGSVRWSGHSKWEGKGLRGSQREMPTPLLVRRDNVGEVGWQSNNSSSAVWQRPILMGEKCELPRFSGLILYDRKGTPIRGCEEEGMITIDNQENGVEDVRITTLGDLIPMAVPSPTTLGDLIPISPRSSLIDH